MISTQTLFAAVNSQTFVPVFWGAESKLDQFEKLHQG